MNKILKLLMLGAIGLVVLAACGPAESAAPVAAPVNEVELAEPEGVEVAPVAPAVEAEVVLEDSLAPKTEAEVVNTEPEAPAAEVEVVLEASDLEEVEETSAEAAVVEAPAEVERDLTDLSYVANTGRPQFLNSFATW